jgi:hypothetical protein
MSRVRVAILATALALCAASAVAETQGPGGAGRVRADGPRDWATAASAAAAPPIDVRASDGAVTLRLSAPTSRIEAGQPLAMELAMEAADGASFEIPLLAKSMGPFDVLSSTRQSSQAGGIRRATLRFTVLTLDSGEVTMPAIPVAVTRPDGTRISLDAGPATITVTSLISGPFDPSAIRDIKGPVTIDVGWGWWWLVAACAAGAMAALAAFTLWHGRARRAEATTPAHEWALAELESLDRDALPESGQTHAHWVRLSGIVREYVERRFDLHAPDRTTPEFLEEARSSASISEDHRALLAQFLRMADMVKFAGMRPTVADCRSALDTARLFVRDTTQSETPEPGPRSAEPELARSASAGGRQ